MRLKLAEGELRGSVDLSQFGKPDLLKDDDDKPTVGQGFGNLGVRPYEIDTDAHGNAILNHKGMSVGPAWRTLSLFVVPKRLGGGATWENLVCCCRRCNTKKGDKSLQASGMQLKRPPRRPRYVPYISLTKYVQGSKNDVWRDYLPVVPDLRD